MKRGVLPSAILTGVFCCIFTLVVSLVAPVLGLAVLMLFSAISGFLGSLFARAVQGELRGDGQDGN